MDVRFVVKHLFLWFESQKICLRNQCDICDQTFVSLQDICDQTFISSVWISQKIRLYNQCDICDKTFISLLQIFQCTFIMDVTFVTNNSFLCFHFPLRWLMWCLRWNICFFALILNYIEFSKCFNWFFRKNLNQRQRKRQRELAAAAGVAVKPGVAVPGVAVPGVAVPGVTAQPQAGKNLLQGNSRFKSWCSE